MSCYAGHDWGSGVHNWAKQQTMEARISLKTGGNKRKQAKPLPIGIETVQPEQIGPGKALLVLVAQSLLNLMERRYDLCVLCDGNHRSTQAAWQCLLLSP
jgi:hypothetical protein